MVLLKLYAAAAKSGLTAFPNTLYKSCALNFKCPIVGSIPPLLQKNLLFFFHTWQLSWRGNIRYQNLSGVDLHLRFTQ